MADFLLFQNVIASLILFANSQNRANIYLGVIFFLNGYQGFSHRLVVNHASVEMAAVLFLNTAPITFLLGPALYFYTRIKIDPNFRLRIVHVAHLLPVLLCLLLLIPYINTSYVEKMKTVESIRMNPHLIFNIKFALGKSSLFFFARPIHVIVYAIVCLRLIHTNHSFLENDKTPFQASILKRWLNVLLYSFALLYVLNLLNMLYGLYFDVELLNPISFIAVLTIFLLNVQIFINPYILYGFNNVKYYSNNSLIAKLYKVNTSSESLFDENLKEELIFKIESAEIASRVTEKGYNLTKMAKDLDIPLYHLNYYFKEISKESFPEFKNKKRIELAIDLINNNYLSDFTVENLSLKCGFSSRANFNNAFQNATGKSLKEFKNSVK